MNITQTNATPVLTKIFAKVAKLEMDVMNENCLITFLGQDNKFYTKTIFQNMVRLDQVIENLGAPDWDHLYTTKGNVVQLALYDGVARYINAATVDQNGQPRAVWKPPVVLASREQAAIYQATVAPPQPEMPVAESDKVFALHVIPGVMSSAPAKDRVTDLYNQLDSDLQLAVLKMMAAMVGAK